MTKSKELTVRTLKLLFIMFALTLGSLGCATGSKRSDGVQVAKRGNLVCASGSRWHVYVSSELPEVWQGGIIRAIDSWRGALGSSWQVDVVISDQANGSLKEACRLDFVPARGDDIPSTAWAAYDGVMNPNSFLPAVGAIWCDVDDARITDEVAYATSLHELGHFVGLDHDADKTHHSIMYPFITTPGRIYCQDVRQACEIWACSTACSGQ